MLSDNLNVKDSHWQSLSKLYISNSTFCILFQQCTCNSTYIILHIIVLLSILEVKTKQWVIHETNMPMQQQYPLCWTCSRFKQVKIGHVSHVRLWCLAASRAPTDSRLWNYRLFQDFFRTRNNFFKDRQWQEFYKSVSKNMNGQSHSRSEWSQSHISAFLINQKQI